MRQSGSAANTDRPTGGATALGGTIMTDENAPRWYAVRAGEV